MVRALFKKAVDKAPIGLPFFIFIDVNAPIGEPAVEYRWKEEVQVWMGRIPAPSEEEPDIFNALYVTSFSPHYDADSISRGGSWLAARRVPAIAEDDMLLSEPTPA